MTWLSDLQVRFASRSEFTPDELREAFRTPRSVSTMDFAQALSIFQEAYGIAPGLLLGDDHLSVFIQAL